MRAVTAVAGSQAAAAVVPRSAVAPGTAVVVEGLATTAVAGDGTVADHRRFHRARDGVLEQNLHHNPAVPDSVEMKRLGVTIQKNAAPPRRTAVAEVTVDRLAPCYTVDRLAEPLAGGSSFDNLRKDMFKRRLAFNTPESAFHIKRFELETVPQHVVGSLGNIMVQSCVVGRGCRAPELRKVLTESGFDIIVVIQTEEVEH